MNIKNSTTWSKESVAKWVSLAVMLLCSAWFAARWKESGFPWDPTVPFVLALGVYVTADIKQARKRTKAPHASDENDAALFRELHDLLPSHGAIAFIKQHDFGGSFRLEDLDPINRFCYEWDNPQHQFNAPELEAQRADLLRAAKYFSNSIAVNTVPRSSGIQSAIPNHIDSDGPFPEWVKQDIREIHLAAEALVEEHEKMMRLGRQLVPLRPRPVDRS